MFNRKALITAGAAVVTTGLFAAPAHAAPAYAASAARAEVAFPTIVQFTAAAGQTNSLTITVSGQTVTLDDRVSIKPGPGCTSVKGDRTKVRCTTPRTPTHVRVVLGDRNDKVTNRTGLSMSAEGQSGNDTLLGGSNHDVLFGGGGKDRLYGYGEWDSLFGGPGNDQITQ